MYPYDFGNNFNNFNPYQMGNFVQNANSYGQQFQQQQQSQAPGRLDIVTVQTIQQVEQIQINSVLCRLNTRSFEAVLLQISFNDHASDIHDINTACNCYSE